MNIEFFIIIKQMNIVNRKRKCTHLANAVSTEIERAQRVLYDCAKIEEEYVSKKQKILNDRSMLSKIYNDSKTQSNEREAKQREEKRIALGTYKNYFTSIERKIHPTTRNAMLKKIEAKEMNEKLLQEAYDTRWKKLDEKEIVRRYYMDRSYLQLQEQYNATINSIIREEEQSKIVFANYIAILEN